MVTACEYQSCGIYTHNSMHRCIPGDFPFVKSLRLPKASILLFYLTTAAVCQAAKQTPVGNQGNSMYASNTSDNMFSPEGASVSPRPSSSTQSKGAQRPSFGCGCGKCTFYSYIKNGCPDPIPITTSFPCLDVKGLTHEQHKKLKSRLRVESQEIMFRFQQLLSRVYESLCKRKVPVGKLVTHLLSLGALDPVYKDAQKPLFQTFFQELQNATSIEGVLWVIRDYFSFFNYHVIEHIVCKLGTVQDKVELQNYKKEFHQYSKRRIYECPPVYGPRSNTDHADLVVKADSVYEKFTVEEVENLEYRLTRIFNVSPQSVLRLCKLEEGCVQLTFQVPSFVQQEIFPLSREQEKDLAAMGVTKLTCGEYKFPVKSAFVYNCHSIVYVFTLHSNFSYRKMSHHNLELVCAFMLCGRQD